MVFPAESHAEKEGSLTHPDGRLQRLRQAIGHPNEVRAGWWVLAELCERAGAGLDAQSPPALTDKVAEAVPFYGGVMLEEIGGQGVRWQERGAASSLPTAQPSDAPLEEPAQPSRGSPAESGRRCGGARRSSTRPRCASSPDIRVPSSPWPTLAAWASPPATRCWCRSTARACAPRPRSAPR